MTKSKPVIELIYLQGPSESKPSRCRKNVMIPFYERSLEERLALTETVIREKRTLVERWIALDNTESSRWNRRAAIAATYLRGQPAVADIGCGTMILRAHLQSDQNYFPLDDIPRNSFTVVCDLNNVMPPETGATAAAMLGVIEYLHDPASVLLHLSKQYMVLVVSYCFTDGPGAPANRREHGWVNDHSNREIVELFRNTGWSVMDQTVVNGWEYIWQLMPTGHTQS